MIDEKCRRCSSKEWKESYMKLTCHLSLFHPPRIEDWSEMIPVWKCKKCYCPRYAFSVETGLGIVKRPVDVM